MTTSNTSVSRFKALAGRVKDRLIAVVVPKHTRRAIFACSLAARLSPSDPTNYPNIAQNLCKDLDLVCAYNAMLAPMSWNSRIWKGLPEIDLPAEAKGPELISAATQVMQHVPKGLVYGNPRIMLEDTINTLRTLVRDRTSHPHAHV